MAEPDSIQPGSPDSGPAAGSAGMRRTLIAARLPLALELFRPGMRVAVAVSGGADSVALLRALAQEQAKLGLVLSIAHMHHGIRGAAADQDAAFVEALAAEHGLRCLRRDVDTPAMAKAAGEGLEETARRLRYSWFADLLSASASGSDELDAVATAHTLNDQAETVLHRLVRGAWTEGLAGIYPVLEQSAAKGSQAASGSGRILRPLLGASREQVIAWLGALGQPWREDATNADTTYTRNRIRHQLLPELETYNPRIATQLAQVATIARDEEAYWQKEVARLLPDLLLPGRAVRGGGRASSTVPGERSLAIEVERLRSVAPALLRRLLRAAAGELGVALDFEQTARLLAMVEQRASPRREELTSSLRAERTPRELRLVLGGSTGGAPGSAPGSGAGSDAREAIEISIPGQGEGFGWRLRCTLADAADPDAAAQKPALLRAARAGDRVQLRYSRGAPKRVKEVLDRMGIGAAERIEWPVLEWRGTIVWMAGAALDSSSAGETLRIDAEPI